MRAVCQQTMTAASLVDGRPSCFHGSTRPRSRVTGMP